MKEEADKRKKKKPSAIQSLAGAMANAAVGQAKSMAGTAGRVAKAPGNVARSMAGTAGRVGRAVNPFD
jgi:type IV secretory pathway TrbL component